MTRALQLAYDYINMIELGYTVEYSEHMRMRKAALEALRAELAKPTAQPAQEPFAWAVCSVNKDGSLSLEHCASWQEAAHEHINDAITEHQIEGAAAWVVRPLYIAAQPAQELEDLSGVRVCCGEYAKCHRPCTPRGAWQASQAQPAQEPRPPNCGTGHCSCIECHDPAYRAMVRGETQPAQELTDEQKQEIHNQTGAGHALICLVESYIRAGGKA